MTTGTTDRKPVQEPSAWSIWLGENPLRKMRRKGKMTLIGASARLGVTMSAVQKWEAGAARPTPENMGKIADTFGRAAKALDREWTSWRASQPD